jgi:GNAT superfamily N-acetyltransferase
MHEINKYLKGKSKQFICKKESILVGGSIVKLRGGINRGGYEILIIASSDGKRGVGTALISFMCKHYAELDIDKLYVNADVLAKRFYEKQGFKDVDEADKTLISRQTTLPEGFIHQKPEKRLRAKRSAPNVLKRQEEKRIRKENREKMPDLPQIPLSKNGVRRQRKNLQRKNGINDSISL